MADEIVVSLSETQPTECEYSYARPGVATVATGSVWVSIYSIGFKGSVYFTFIGEAAPPNIDPTLTPDKTSVYLDEDDDHDHRHCFAVIADGDAAPATITVIAQAFGGSPSDSAVKTITLS